MKVFFKKLKAVSKLKGSGAFLTTGLERSNENGPIFVVRETIKGLKNFKISIKSQKKLLKSKKLTLNFFSRLFHSLST